MSGSSSGGSTGGATTVVASDTVVRSVTGDVLSGTENGVNKTYTYDNAGRLTGATIGNNTYGYDYSAPQLVSAHNRVQTSARTKTVTVPK